MAARLLDVGFAGLLVGTGLLRAPGGAARWVQAVDACRTRAGAGAGARVRAGAATPAGAGTGLGLGAGR